jgi:heat shock protein HtpX
VLPAFGLYTHIASNRRRSVALILGLLFLVYLITYAVALLGRVWIGLPDDGPPGLEGYLVAAARDCLWWLPVATLGTLGWVSLSYWFHQTIIDLVTGSRSMERADNPRLYGTLEELCISRGLAMPKLKVMETEAVNAFATGLDPEQYAITVTRGLLDALNEDEIEAVLAHELTHIRNDDVRMVVIAVVVAGIISFVAEIVFRGLRHVRWSGGSGSGSKRKGGGGAALAAIAIALAALGVAWFLSLVIRFALMRSREFLADAGAVELTKKPDALISALLKINGKGELDGVPSGVMEMCVDNPRQGFADLFATHPSIEERIDALVRYAGGRRPVAAADAVLGEEPPRSSTVPPIAPAA